MKRILPFLMALAFPALVSAQSAPSDSLARYHHKFSVGLSAGLPGFGGYAAYNLSPHFNLKARANFLSFKNYDYQYNIDDRPLDMQLNADLLTMDMVVEYLPFRGSSFKIVAGASYIKNIDASAKIMLAETVQFGEIEMEPEQVGDLEIGLNYSGVAPYLGIGFGRAVPKKRIGFGFEGGCYYTSAPDVNMAASGLLTPSANPDQEQNLEEALSSFRFMPCILFNVSVRLN